MLQGRPVKRFYQSSPPVGNDSLAGAIDLLVNDAQVPAHLKTVLGHLLDKADRIDELMARNHSSTKKGIKRSKQHVVTSEPQQAEENSDNDATVLHLNKQRSEAQPERNKVVLLAGQAKVLDFQNHPRDTTVLLDTGSELSFIDEDFATELGLPIEETTSLLISTFGSQTPSPKRCNITTAKMCDMEGCEHVIRLYRSDYITGAIDQAELDQGDLDFISKQGINLILPGKRSSVQPQILLGCDYLWNFIMPMDEGTSRVYPKSSQQSLESGNGDMGPVLVSGGSGNSIQRRQDGYYVRLPWKQHHPPLPDNKMIALKRLQAIMQMYAHNSDI
ncbi:unnamed protein product [Heligmosomoides polygyrus]|uniref:DUF1758 domain-containing protein n=1 Tax=Heligmosomoides polygyrus TaxID=6339 RepID=A0A183GFJ3_HELPZ|nr:unnamed protein product [Heligmosomoides polygyrus]